MKVLVIGATGATGKAAVQKLLARGDEVTAFARKPADVTETHARLRTAQGDARDLASLERALEGQDAVLAAFGPRALGKDDLQEVFARNLIAAMKKRGVQRLVNLSAWGSGDSRPHMTFVFKLIRHTILKNVFDDKERGEELLAASDLDVTNVRPGRLVNEPARGGARASLQPDGLKPTMTREDLAAFMVDELHANAWVRKSPLIGY
ncbi:MAG: flavin reductase [Myxococcaceae bacterium]|nr:flavin reductase [Myxococcaceae bacterium]